jgi:hypothetical protein
MTTNFRDLIVELVDHLEAYESNNLYCDSDALITRARAALAEPQPPADDEVVNPWKDAVIDALICNCILKEEHELNPRKALNDLISWEFELARDPLINPPLQPHVGEVRELVVSEIVRNLRTKAVTEKANACHYSSTLLTRAADLLERLAQDHVQGATKMAEPTDEEFLSVDDLRNTWNAEANAVNDWDELGIDEIIWWAQRQALARWGTSNLAEIRSSLGGSHLRDRVADGGGGTAVMAEGLEQSAMTDSRSPSSAATTVLDAMYRSYDHEPTRRAVAASILRAVVDQVVPESPMLVSGGRTHEEALMATVQDAIRLQFLDIAAELEDSNA